MEPTDDLSRFKKTKNSERNKRGKMMEDKIWKNV